MDSKSPRYSKQGGRRLERKLDPVVGMPAGERIVVGGAVVPMDALRERLRDGDNAIEIELG